MITQRILIMFTEPSTWRGLVAVAGALGLKFTDVNPTDLLSLAITIVGVIEILRKERSGPPNAG